MTLIIYTKSLSPCNQCDMTIRRAKAESVDYEVIPGIDTPEYADTLERFKALGLASAPIVEVVASDDAAPREVLDRWAGFRPDKIKEYAA